MKTPDLDERQDIACMVCGGSRKISGAPCMACEGKGTVRAPVAKPAPAPALAPKSAPASVSVPENKPSTGERSSS